MVEVLLWIIAAYTVCVLAVHIVHAWYRRKAPQQPVKQTILITYNQQHQVEWVLRSLLLRSWLQGTQIQLTVIDTGSTDGTLKIIQWLAARASFHWKVFDSELELQRWLAACGAYAEIIDLGQYPYGDGRLTYS